MTEHFLLALLAIFILFVSWKRWIYSKYLYRCFQVTVGMGVIAEVWASTISIDRLSYRSRMDHALELPNLQNIFLHQKLFHFDQLGVLPQHITPIHSHIEGSISYDLLKRPNKYKVTFWGSQTKTLPVHSLHRCCWTHRVPPALCAPIKIPVSSAACVSNTDKIIITSDCPDIHRSTVGVSLFSISVFGNDEQ